MRTVWSLLRSVALFVLLILGILALVLAPLGVLYVKAINLVPNTLLRYLLSLVYFVAVAKGVMWLGRKGMEAIFNRDD